MLIKELLAQDQLASKVTELLESTNIEVFFVLLEVGSDLLFHLAHNGQNPRLAFFVSISTNS